MVARKDVGSWLEGTPPAGGGDAVGPRLRLPATGPGSLASLNRRAPAIVIDWLLCLLIASAFLGPNPLYPLAVFAAENLLLVGTLGYTVGHRVLGIQVRRVLPGTGAAPATGPAGPARAAVRTVLLSLAIPAVIWDGAGRGMHDRAAGTVIVRR